MHNHEFPWNCGSLEMETRALKHRSMIEDCLIPLETFMRTCVDANEDLISIMEPMLRLLEAARIKIEAMDKTIERDIGEIIITESSNDLLGFLERPVFMAQIRQSDNARLFSAFLRTCESDNQDMNNDTTAIG
ncbi:MAG: hypothetical protein PHU03_07730 [Syntrophales bacterium]|nr:hypothetical protein [Syntrophales bacterium]